MSSQFSLPFRSSRQICRWICHLCRSCDMSHHLFLHFTFLIKYLVQSNYYYYYYYLVLITIVFTLLLVRQKSDAPCRLSTSSRRRVAHGRSRQRCHKLLRAWSRSSPSRTHIRREATAYQRSSWQIQRSHGLLGFTASYGKPVTADWEIGFRLSSHTNVNKACPTHQ